MSPLPPYGNNLLPWVHFHVPPSPHFNVEDFFWTSGFFGSCLRLAGRTSQHWNGGDGGDRMKRSKNSCNIKYAYRKRAILQTKPRRPLVQRSVLVDSRHHVTTHICVYTTFLGMYLFRGLPHTHVFNEVAPLSQHFCGHFGLSLLDRFGCCDSGALLVCYNGEGLPQEVVSRFSDTER